MNKHLTWISAAALLSLTVALAGAQGPVGNSSVDIKQLKNRIVDGRAAALVKDPMSASPTVVTKDGKPLAVILSYAEYSRMRGLIDGCSILPQVPNAPKPDPAGAELREQVRARSKALGIEMTPERESQLAKQNMTGLKALLEYVETFKRWPR